MADDDGRWSEERFHLWLEDGRVVAAVWIGPDGYFWCQSWRAPDLSAAAVEAAARWGVSPDSPPPRDELMRPVTWLRAVIPLATHGDREDGLLTAHDAAADSVERFVPRLVSGGLDTTGRLMTLSWPSLRVGTFFGHPDPETAALVAQRLRDRQRQDSEADARHRADQPRRDAEAAAAEAEAAAAEAAARATERDAVIAEWSDVTLSEDAFVTAILDGASQWHLRPWADALLNAVVEAGRPPAARADLVPLADLLREEVGLRRRDLDPFAGYLEAPRSISRLHGAHGDAMRELVDRRDEAFDGLPRDTAAAMHRALGRPLTWGELMGAGAWPVPPTAPPAEEWD